MQAIRPQTRTLATVLLFLTLIASADTQAEDAPPGRLIPPVSLGRSGRALLAPAYTGCGGVPGVPSSNETYEQEVVRLVNEERAKLGLPPLKRVSLLDEAARYFATDMGQDNYWPAPPTYVSHGTYDRDGGSLVYVCDWSARVLSYYQPNWMWLAENIAAGYVTPESVMTGWMGSSGHRANILSTAVWEIGVGYYEGSGTYYRYWVQDFGRRGNVYPLIIDRDAVETDSRAVSLYIYGAGTWTEMRLRNDDGSWTGWQPFQSTLGWTLGCGEGERTVWVEMRAGAQTAVSSDTIRLTAGSTLGNLPGSIQFTYSIPEQRLLPADHQATPLDVESGCPLTWTVAAEGIWFTAAPAGGTAPASFWITPTAFVTNTVVTYTGAVTVTVTDPGGTIGSPHRMDLSLRVRDEPFSRSYLTLVMRDYTPPPPSRYPNDPYYSSQWALEKIDAPKAWGQTTGQGILIAVLDSGADLDHPDLAGKLRTDIDWDFVNNDDEADDDHSYSHGTHVSGIAAAATDNGVGVAGMGWEATILPLKVLNYKGDGDSLTLASAIRYAADNGTKVINMSLGGPAACPSDLQSAVNYAYGKGVVLVAAAGNHDLTHPNAEMLPANCAHVLGVAATDSTDTQASYSNYGNHVSVAAPGSGIYSTLRGGSYGYLDGTSMATPYVAGLAALVLARYPSYTPDQVASAILDNAVDLGTAGWDQYYGCGRIDAFGTVYTGTHGASPLCLGAQPWAVDTGGSAASAASAPFVPGEIVVSFRPGVRAEQAIRQYGFDAELLPVLDVWRLQVPPGQEQTILVQLRSDPSVAYAGLNYLVFAQ